MKSARNNLKAALVLFGAITLLSRSPVAPALNASTDLTQYVHKAWTAQDGLKGTVRSIVQTPDGYLWLGTEFGLVRFDGARFTPWAPPAGQHLPSTNILALFAARAGALWIATLDGLASWNGSKLNEYPQFAGEPVFVVLEDHEGTVWVGGVGKLCSIRGGSVHCDEVAGSSGSNYGYGNRGRGVWSLYEDREGRLWAGADSGLWRVRPGPPQLYLSQTIDDQQSLVEGSRATGVLGIVGGEHELREVVEQQAQPYAAAAVWREAWPRRLLRDRDGALWIGTSKHGLFYVRDGKVSSFAGDNGLSSEHVYALFEDREGSVWVGTTSGSDRFHEPAVATASADQGPSTGATAVLAARDGSLWVGTPDGVIRWNGNRMTAYRSSAPSLAGHDPGQGNGAPGRGEATEIVDPGLPGNFVASLFQDPGGRIWVTGVLGAAWFENGGFHRVPGVPPGTPNAIVTDAHEGVWISSPVDGLFHVVEGKVVGSMPWPWSKAKGDDRRLFALAAENRTGGTWLGFLNGGIAYFKDGQVRQSFGPKDGLGAGSVWNLYIDHEGTLWASTDAGLSRVSDGRIETLTSRNGLPCDLVRWTIEDDLSALWLYTGCGLVRVERSDMQAWISDAKHAIHPVIFDGTDGIRMHTFLSGTDPLVSKAPDGKFWFAHLDGISTFDPRHLALNELPPPVHIEQITANGILHPVVARLRLLPGVRDLALRYTALSLVAPEKVHFRFKLEGQDPDWREVVNIREVQYSNLAPGSYRFRVIASNNSGLWNEQGAALDFSIAPAYWQTNWFRAVCLAALVLMVWALYELRTRQIARGFNARLEERVAERTRIARDLHDTLLQSFQGLLLRCQTARELLRKRPAEAEETLASAIDQTAQAITEGREAVQGLRDSTIERNDLAVAIKTLGGELAADTSGHPSIGFRVEVEGTPRNLHPIVRDEIYRIAGEALRNAFRHAEAKQIEVELRYDERQLRLRVRDDGKGIAPGYLAGEGRTGHFGLPGMRERAKLIRGKLTVWTAPGSGTEIELSVPALHAYSVRTENL
ncbi:MAG: two-component regulator propeller domain-containing protein [Steroidobacteraceae bacterium]